MKQIFCLYSKLLPAGSTTWCSRRSCCQVRNVVTTCLEKILVERAPGEACDYVKGVISDLLMNKLDLSLLVISKVWHPALAWPSFHHAYHRHPWCSRAHRLSSP